MFRYAKSMAETRKIRLIQEIEKDIARIENILVNTPKEMESYRYKELLVQLESLRQSLSILKTM
jgi:hypothetical protein